MTMIKNQDCGNKVSSFTTKYGGKQAFIGYYERHNLTQVVVYVSRVIHLGMVRRCVLGSLYEDRDSVHA